MILGTVELGMPYGINNKEGKPEKTAAFDILNAAWLEGIREIDTAAAYGDSEIIIGEFQTEKKISFEIDTKLPTEIHNNEYKAALDQSIQRTGCKRINLLYVHSFEQCKNEQLMAFLRMSKETCDIREIGISIYDPKEMEHIIDNYAFIDVIQFPFNIFDNQRWKNNGLLEKCKRSGIKLYARSIFLQGLLFREPEDAFIKRLGLSRHVDLFQDLCKKEGVTTKQFAIEYVRRNQWIDDYIIGCSSTEEVYENVAISKSPWRLSDDSLLSVEELSYNIPTKAIDPRTWSA